MTYLTFHFVRQPQPPSQVFSSKCTIIFKLSNFQLKQKLFLLRLSLFSFNFLQWDISLIHRTFYRYITRSINRYVPLLIYRTPHWFIGHSGNLYKMSGFMLPLKLSQNSSVIRQKGESQNGYFKKTKHTKFPEKRTFFYPLIRTRTFFSLITDK